MNVQVQEFTSREEWLKERSTFIGGSEITSLLGLNDYQSPYDLWLLKTGREQPQADNKHTISGRFLEDGIAKMFEYETDHVIIKASDGDFVYRHPKYPFIAGSPDRRIRWNGSMKESDKAVLEVKTTMKIIDVDDIPIAWRVQPNFYCGLLGYKRFIIVWFEFFTKELKWQEYEFNQELYDICINETVDFWNNHILLDKEPEITTPSDVAKKFPQAEPCKEIIASDEVEQLYSQAIDVSRKKSAITKQYAEITDKIKVIMKDAERLVSHSGFTLFTFSGDKRRTLRIKEI